MAIRELHHTEITPYSHASRRTRQRWKAHTNNKCNDKCRFCRKEDEFSSGNKVVLQVPNSLPDCYSSFGSAWKEWVAKLSGHILTLSTFYHMPYDGFSKKIPGWHFHDDPDHPKQPCGLSRWVPTAWVRPALLDIPGVINETERYRQEVKVKVKKNLAKLFPNVKQVGVEPQKIETAQSVSAKVPASKVTSMTMIDTKTVEGALQHEVGYHYVAAAANVAREKAQAEINRAAMTPGMMVWHVFDHKPYVLIRHQDRSDTWRVHDASGNQLDFCHAMLRPMKPNIFKRSWASISQLAMKATIAYHNKTTWLYNSGAKKAAVIVGTSAAVAALAAVACAYGLK